jgi:hypothetical protein
MGGKLVRTIGSALAKVNVGLKNLTYIHLGPLSG